MTTSTTITTADDLIAGLRAQGATSVPPNRQAGRDAAEDAAGARHLRCHHCGRRGLTWHALWLRGSYVAVCACPRCGAGERA